MLPSVTWLCSDASSLWVSPLKRGTATFPGVQGRAGRQEVSQEARLLA